MKNTFHILQPILFFTYSTICIFVYCKKNIIPKEKQKKSDSEVFFVPIFI